MMSWRSFRHSVAAERGRDDSVFETFEYAWACLGIELVVDQGDLSDVNSTVAYVKRR